MAAIELYKVGQNIDQYVVLKTLNATQNSHLYIVQGKNVHKRQVLKLHAGSLSDKSCSIFTHQANLLLEFSSQPNIVDVLHVGTIVESASLVKPSIENASTSDKVTQANERPFMVMPFYPQTLNDLLAVHHQKLSFVTSLHIINQVIDGLHAIHHLGIAHLDIKPQNIFLDEHNNALLADFDSAVVLNSSPLAARFPINNYDSSIVRRSTPDYASPEQTLAIDADDNHYININNISTASDVYSLGVLWFRMLTGALLQKPVLEGTLHTQLENIAPAWAIELIKDLLNNNKEQRPSASLCKSRILAQMQAPEVNQTVQADVLEIPQEIAAIQQEIKRILLQQGWLNEQDKERLLLSFRSGLQTKSNVANYESNLSNQKDSLQQIIDACQAQLIADKNLLSWFGWINYVKALLAKSGKRLTISQYQQVLQVGRAARPDDPNAAEWLLKQHFQLPSLSFQKVKRYALPVFVILLVFIYWGHDSQTKKQFSVDTPFKSEPQGIASDVSADILSKTVLSVPNDIALFAHEPMEKVYDLEPLGKSFAAAGAYILFTEQENSTNKIIVEWVRIDSLPEIRIMATEVTNQLYALCAQEGACRQVKQFSSASKAATMDLPGHPKVNIDWYEITQQFIPWLNQKTQKRFSLPSSEQWRLMRASKQRINNNKIAIHCKNCNHSLARQYAGVTMPVKAINPDENLMYHVLGNVQEWLNDCWQQRSADNTFVERCDQAMVMGGSWISKKSGINEQPLSQLLKSARTPTTGFRLVEWINE
ncbi:MAG: serine/threonine protein kinase [Alphaproteobacteria bacterium]|jgi:serine/threonine protein kinase